jgi:broad specificity phosphatase PhoE
VILWVRHGESTWNAMDRLQGHELGPPLTDLGREQAARTAELLVGRGVVRLLSSPAVRAQQTAEIIGERLGLEVEVEPLLLEKGLDEERETVLGRIRELLARDLPEHTVAVSHGDTIGYTVAMLTGEPPMLPDNGSITSVDSDTRQTTVTMP